MAVFRLDKLPCQLRYRVDCHTAWHTRTARVEGWLGGNAVKAVIAALPDQRWSLNGTEQPLAAGCIDVDLGFTPATNLIPLRRIHIPLGGTVEAPAAWLPFPALRLERLEQQYRREEPCRYRYSAPSVGYNAVLTVTDGGLITDYPRLWELVSISA